MTKKQESKRSERNQHCPEPKGKLIAIGGKESKGQGERTQTQEENKDFIEAEILRRFVDELPGSNDLVALVPTASTLPEESAQDYQQAFSRLGIKNIQVIDIRSRQQAYDPAFYDMVEKAGGIMFTGGDQLRLTSMLGGTPILHLMKERYTYEPLVIGGTSAGAAAMSTPMIYEGQAEAGFIRGDVRITTGLEFLKDVAIDTHFIARGRIVRMAQTIAMNPGCIGVGLEEDTAVLVSRGREFEVLGSGIVTVLDGMGMSETNFYEIGTGQAFTARDLRIHLLARGKRYEFPTLPQLHQ